MEDKLLQAFVIFISLLASQRDNPSIRDEEHVDAHRDNERLQKQARESLDQEVAAAAAVNHHTSPQDDTTSFDGEQPKPPGTESEQDFTEGVTEKRHLEESVEIRQDLEEENPERQPPADEDAPAGPDPNRLGGPEDAFKDETDPAEVYDEGQTGVREVEVEAQGDAEQTGEGSDKSLEQPEKKMEASNSEKQDGEAPPPPPDHALHQTSERSDMLAGWEDGFLWYIWSAFSFISTVRFLRKYIWSNLRGRRAAARTASDAPLPDTGVLRRFYSKHLQVPSHTRRRREEFLDGFMNDLLGSMSAICDKNGDMGVEGFEIMDAGDIIVPLKPPKSYLFQCVWGRNAGGGMPDQGAHGQIKMMQMRTTQSGCQCQAPDADDDMLCLLHGDNVETEVVDVVGGPLCAKNSPFLSAPQVSRWFQRTLRLTWEQISHKYEFELGVDVLGTLAVRFRSGKRMSFHVRPVVKIRPDAHLYLHPGGSPGRSDVLWTLSLAVYEDRLLDHLARRFPEDACHSEVLKIALFLHWRQTALTGGCALNETHFKSALLHLILVKNQSQWKTECLSLRLRDLLVFLERSLKGKSLHHALIGNPLAKCVELPVEFIQTKPLNLLHPLVVDDCTYTNTLLHFQELLRNAQMLIVEYAATKCDHTNGSARN